MSASISIFRFESSELRTITDEHGEPWFVLADVCHALELANPSMVKSRLDEVDVQTIDLSSGVFTLNNGEGKKATNVINESGLYACIFQGRTDEARRYKRWVTAEVLPSIRKTGKYAIEQKALTPSEIILMQAQQLVDIERKQAEQARIAAEQADKLARIEAKQEAFEKGINDFSIVAYCGYKGFPSLSLEQAQRLGKAASKLCRESGLPVGKIRDPRFGHINSYPETVLEQVFAGEFDF